MDKYEVSFSGRTLTEEEAAAEKATHKKASRVYFDMLTEFFPPQDTQEFWERLVDRMVQVSAESGGSKLLGHLVQALFMYFEDLVAPPKD